MNLIEIAEDLKNVPDQYLMQEVQQPTGNFPAYLVVSELGRRKRMREKVAKEMPTQTVAEELATPPQMPQMPQMGTMMPQGAPQAGLMAMPQAQTELAAQDAMGTTPPEMMMPQQMAGGGMVSFRQGGDVIRAFNGLPSSMFPNSVTTQEDVEAYRPRGFGSMFGLMPEGAGAGNIDYELTKLGYPREQLATMDPATKRYIVANATAPTSFPAAVAPRAVVPTAAPAAAPTAPGAPPAAPPVAQAAPQFQPAAIPTAMSDYARQTARAQGLSDYEQAVPDRTTKFFTEDIARREADVEKRRSTNISDALIQAGLGAMRAKPKFGGTAGLFEVIGEGGQAGFDVLRQGRKDIMQSEEAISASRAKMIEAQMLRDDRKFKAAEDAEKRAIELDKFALDRANTESAIALRNLQGSITAQEAPARQDLLRAQAENLRNKGTAISTAQQNAANDYAQQKLIANGILPNNPKYAAEYARYRNEYLTDILQLGAGIPAAASAPTAIDYSQAINASVSGN
jgi:hypothetical protein